MAVLRDVPFFFLILGGPLQLDAFALNVSTMPSVTSLNEAVLTNAISERDNVKITSLTMNLVRFDGLTK